MLKTNDTNYPSFACSNLGYLSLKKGTDYCTKKLSNAKKRSRIKRYKNARMKINYAVCILLNL